MPAVTNRQTFKEYCLENKYTKWYFSIIKKAEVRNWNKKTSPVYGELHQAAMTRVHGEKQPVHKGFSKCHL